MRRLPRGTSTRQPMLRLAKYHGFIQTPTKPPPTPSSWRLVASSRQGDFADAPRASASHAGGCEGLDGGDQPFRRERLAQDPRGPVPARVAVLAVAGGEQERHPEGGQPVGDRLHVLPIEV